MRILYLRYQECITKIFDIVRETYEVTNACVRLALRKTGIESQIISKETKKKTEEKQ